MSRLENKLKELNYTLHKVISLNKIVYRKTNIGGYLDITIHNDSYCTGELLYPLPISTEYELKNINNAFKILQSNLKELKEYE